MKRLFFVANWKANKTALEAQKWLQEISNFLDKARSTVTSDQVLISSDGEKERTVIVCPGFQLLSTVKEEIQQHSLAFEIGAQDVSAFPLGAHTGEVPAELIKEFAAYAIIGHSERREKMHENEEILEKKVALALSSGLQIIYCIRGVEDAIPMGVTIAAYEPIGAIGSGHPDTPENAQEVADQIKEKYPHVQFVLYGGSVTAENVSSYTAQPAIDGVLVGGASLDAQSFAQIIQNS